MFAAIAAARDHINLETYILEDDDVGRRFADALIERQRAGVQVNLIHDSVGTLHTANAFFERLEASGIRRLEYNPVNPLTASAGWDVNQRDHRKLLVVDGAGGVIGGIGLGHEWTTGTHPGDKDGSAWRDTAVNIDGPAGRDMQNAFERSWDRVVNRAKTDSDDSRPTERPSDDSLDNGGAMVAIMEGEPGRQRVTRALEVVTVAARSSIWISDAYFMPNMALVEALVGAARDGVDVRLLVPSRGDHPWMIRGTRKYYPRLLKNGVRIWEWKGEMMHAKTGVSDGQFVRIGSTDYNALGMAINFELDAMIHDEELGGAMTAMFEDDIARSKRIELDVAKD
jgi:cardiolipin synthase